MIRVTIAIPLAVAACSLVGVLALGRLEQADRTVDSALTRLSGIHSKLSILHSLQQGVRLVELAPRPQQDLISRVQDTLLDSALPAQRLRNLISQGEYASTASGPYKTQKVQIELSPISPSELGRFLHSWAEKQPAWAVERIQLNRTPGDAVQYSATLGLAATFLKVGTQS